MTEQRSKSKLGGIIFGPIIIVVSLVALWKNEHRFDYHKAAGKTPIVYATGELKPDQVFSYTGAMDQGLTFDGEYVESFTGYLSVWRKAEIYAWDKDEDDDRVTWKLRWMTSVERNERNTGVEQELWSESFKPDTYQVDDLIIQTDKIEFVDSKESIYPTSLALTQKGTDKGLHTSGQHYYLSKGQSDRLGDERISYTAVKVPTTATYFGKSVDGVGMAHQAKKREGMISDLINDTGVLHHVVAGERQTALATMKAHFNRVKTIVRWVGIAVNAGGWAFLFSAVTGFMFHIPLIGPLISRAVGLAGMVVGVLTGGIVIVAGYLTSHPILLVLLVGVIGGVVYYVRSNAKRTQEQAREQVQQEIGHYPSRSELKELEFMELVQLGQSNGDLAAGEANLLRDFASRQGWEDAHAAKLYERASSHHAPSIAGTNREKLKRFIRFSLADGYIDKHEQEILEKVASANGVGRDELGRLIQEIRHAGVAA